MEHWRDLMTLAYEAVGDDSEWPDFLVALNQNIRGERSFFSVTDFARRQVPVGVSSLNDPEWLKSYVAHYCWVSPLFEPLMKKGVGWTGNLDLPRKAYHSEFYADFMAPKDLHHVMMGHIGSQAGCEVAIASVRSKRHGVFERRAEMLLARIVEQIRWAFALRHKLEHANGRGTGSLSAWEVSPQAAILLDARRKVAYMNPAAMGLMGTPWGLSVQENRLSAARSGEHQDLERLIHDALHPGQEDAQAGGTMALPSRDLGATLQIQVHPLNLAREDFSLGGSRIAAAVFLTPVPALSNGSRARAFVPTVTRVAQPGSDADALPSAELLTARFGLTRAEARLAQALAQGQGVKQAAEALEISYNTARTRLKEIYGKTGTHRQSALVSQILRTREPAS